MAEAQRTRICSVDGCGRTPHGRGMCTLHYKRWMKFGDALVSRDPKSINHCSVDGCDRKYRSGGYCGMHYARVRATGRPGTASTAKLTDRDTCNVEDCSNKVRCRNLCGKHYSRWRSFGESGLTQVSWYDPGYVINYYAAHKRTREKRGRASLHACIDCGQSAKQWAYQHGDPDAYVSERGLAYSVDPMRYEPMCIPCHKRLDARIRGLAKAA